MRRILLYTLIAAFSFITFTIVMAPASTAWSLAGTNILNHAPGLGVYRVQGSVWNGQADLHYLQFPTSQLSWEVEPFRLFSGIVASKLLLAGESHQFNGELDVSKSSLKAADITGYVDADYINQVSQPQGVTFSGRIELKALSFESDLHWINAVSGTVYWPGGKIISRTRAAGTQVFDLPALMGDISLRGDAVNLNIHAGQNTLIDILIKPDGWILVAVKARLFDVANLPWPAGSSLDDTVIQFEEKLF